MAIGKVNYKMGQNLEPIAQAITSMNQPSSKKDKPVEMAKKIKAISTDATAVEGNVLKGQTFYAGGIKKTGNMANRGAWTGRIGVNGKIAIPAGYHNGSGYVDQSITAKGSITPAVSVTGNNPMYVRMTQGAYFTNASSGYPEASVTLAQLRGAGLALQSELTAMTNDRNNWMNIANSRPTKYTGLLKAGTTFTFDINNFPRIYLNWQSTSGNCHANIHRGTSYGTPYLFYQHFNGSSQGYGATKSLDSGDVSGTLRQTSGSSYSGKPTIDYSLKGSTMTLVFKVVPTGSDPSDSTAITYEYYI